MKIDDTNYVIAILLNESEKPFVIDAKFVNSVENLFKMRVPLTVQAMLELSTQKCGKLTFYETLTGDIVCPDCALNRAKQCPLPFGAIQASMWNYSEI